MVKVSDCLQERNSKLGVRVEQDSVTVLDHFIRCYPSRKCREVPNDYTVDEIKVSATLTKAGLN